MDFEKVDQAKIVQAKIVIFDDSGALSWVFWRVNEQFSLWNILSGKVRKFIFVGLSRKALLVGFVSF